MVTTNAIYRTPDVIAIKNSAVAQHPDCIVSRRLIETSQERNMWLAG